MNPLLVNQKRRRSFSEFFDYKSWFAYLDNPVEPMNDHFDPKFEDMWIERDAFMRKAAIIRAAAARTRILSGGY